MNRCTSGNEPTRLEVFGAGGGGGATGCAGSWREVGLEPSTVATYCVMQEQQWSNGEVTSVCCHTFEHINRKKKLTVLDTCAQGRTKHAEDSIDCAGSGRGRSWREVGLEPSTAATCCVMQEQQWSNGESDKCLLPHVWTHQQQQKLTTSFRHDCAQGRTKHAEDSIGCAGSGRVGGGVEASTAATCCEWYQRVISARSLRHTSTRI